MLDQHGHSLSDRVLLSDSHWDRYNSALASSLREWRARWRDAKEIAEAIKEINP